MLNLFNQQLAQSVHLTDDQVTAAVAQLTDESVCPASKPIFSARLPKRSRLRRKSPPSPANCAPNPSCRRSTPKPAPREILDVCGTGGDRLNTFNISTTVAFVCAAAGCNRRQTWQPRDHFAGWQRGCSGSLGVKIELTPEEAARSLREHHFAFFFAPHYHPAFRHISAARKICAERGQRTIFNFLGPLLNPARPSAQLVGVLRPELCPTLARVLQSLGVRRGMVVSGRVGDAWLDELSTLGENTLAEFYQDRGFAGSVISPAHFPMQPATLADLAGGDRDANAEIIRRLLRQ